MQITDKNTEQYEELFTRYYHTALKWSLKITRYDYDLADDLVHNVYLQFENVRRSGKSFKIETFDKYLYISLRNSYITHLRKNNKIFEKEEMLDDGFLLSIDPREQIKVQDQLFDVCRYACLRKNTSISCSVLILRFFHGYFPSEIAQIINSSRNVVESRLVSARREAALYLKNPEDFDFGEQNLREFAVSSGKNNSPSNTLQNLQNIIFNSRRGICFEPQQIAERYTRGKNRLSRGELSHVVSCRRCLDETNKYLNLITLEQRDPIYSLRRESSSAKTGETSKILIRRAAA